ncbi:hypothetical protein G7067_11780 [Leucobacter insecticola]|uniref:Uncharacterized protein n=1 Tax=Leucobacter insecticola TaxID=2714934 RepID=A0A6G8FKN1_9MICO|nr:hypothetical protein [Leucobacter insecticola]QIM16925.1 hypothetical protein G7067_11780 [Leucobacter insecticola]
MSDFKIEFEVENPNEPPFVDVHHELQCYALWMSGKFGYDNVDGHEIGLSAELVQDLLAWVKNGDATFNHPDPLEVPYPDNFLEDGYELARRVRAELPAEWVVTTWSPALKADVVLPLES